MMEHGSLFMWLSTVISIVRTDPKGPGYSLKMGRLTRASLKVQMSPKGVALCVS